jgi:hypothetical protein
MIVVKLEVKVFNDLTTILCFLHRILFLNSYNLVNSQLLNVFGVNSEKQRCSEMKHLKIF